MAESDPELFNNVGNDWTKVSGEWRANVSSECYMGMDRPESSVTILNKGKKFFISNDVHECREEFEDQDEEDYDPNDVWTFAELEKAFRPQLDYDYVCLLLEPFQGKPLAIDMTNDKNNFQKQLEKVIPMLTTCEDNCLMLVRDMSGIQYMGILEDKSHRSKATQVCKGLLEVKKNPMEVLDLVPVKKEPVEVMDLTSELDDADKEIERLNKLLKQKKELESKKRQIAKLKAQLEADSDEEDDIPVSKRRRLNH